MASRKQYRDWNPGQGYLLPPSPSDWLPDDDLAYFILDIVEVLDLSAIHGAFQRKDRRGTRPYDPKMMVALLLYGYCVGVVSSRKIEQATYRDVAFRVIAADTHPDHSVISDFRRRHLKALKRLFLQTVRLSQKAGLVALGRVALDGTKVQANASKHKAMSYERMLKNEKKLKTEIDDLMARAEATDREEDERFGPNRRGDEMPDELRRREQRLQKIQEAKAALESEARQTRIEDLEAKAQHQREQAVQAPDPVERKRAATRAAKLQSEADELRGNDDNEGPPTPADGGLPHHRVPTTTEGKPTDKAQRNFTDPDSRIMKRGHTYLQGYNGQAAVDETHQIIVSCGLSNQAPDQEYLPALVDQVCENCEKPPDQLLADNGYWDDDNVLHCEASEIDPYIAAGRQKHGEQPPPVRGRSPRDLGAKDRMRRKLSTQSGAKTYARRKAIVEPVFGQMKEARGLRRFLLRGIRKVEAEWTLWCTGHNLLKLYRAQTALA